MIEEERCEDRETWVSVNAYDAYDAQRAAMAYGDNVAFSQPCSLEGANDPDHLWTMQEPADEGSLGGYRVLLVWRAWLKPSGAAASTDVMAVAVERNPEWWSAPVVPDRPDTTARWQADALERTAGSAPTARSAGPRL